MPKKDEIRYYRISQLEDKKKDVTNCISCNTYLRYETTEEHERNAIKELDNCVSCTYKIIQLLNLK